MWLQITVEEPFITKLLHFPPREKNIMNQLSSNFLSSVSASAIFSPLNAFESTNTQEPVLSMTSQPIYSAFLLNVILKAFLSSKKHFTERDL